MTRIRELRWRPDRVDHIARHGISPDEVEEAVYGDSVGLLLRVGRAEREPDQVLYNYHGRTAAGRYLFVVLIHEGGDLAMPVTAREMTRSEKRRYLR